MMDFESDYFASLVSDISYDKDTGIFTWVNPSKYHLNISGTECGAWIDNRGKKYLTIQYNGVKWRAHRLAWIITYRENPYVIDHIDGDTENNRISNLRDVGFIENAQNHLSDRRISKKKMNLPLGVRINKGGRYSARITVNGILRTIGTFDTSELAHMAYIRERRKHHDCPTIK